MRVLIIGYGRSGRAAEALARTLGMECRVLADDGRDRIGEGHFDFAVVSPGVALTHPWIVEAKARGIPLRSELQFGCEELRRRGWKLLAVTGSKGKSSVVKVVADAISLSGQRAVACGNYGIPVAEVANSNPQTLKPSNLSPWAVVEVSSFMMETTDLPSDAFEAAAILNLQEDHLDRHGSVETYHALKRRLLTMTKAGLDFSAGSSATCDLIAGSYFDNEVLAVNGLAAVRLMEAAGVDRETVRGAFAAFVPLPHRMNLVAEINGVSYIDDSKATSLAALLAGVKMAAGKTQKLTTSSPQTIRLIAGGLPKGDDPKSVLPILTERVKKVYIIGQCAEEFFAAWTDAVDCEICGTIDTAVEKAMREAERGEAVLLSPGTASFDQFKSFGERGEVFARLVKKGKMKNE